MVANDTVGSLILPTESLAAEKNVQGYVVAFSVIG